MNYDIVLKKHWVQVIHAPTSLDFNVCLLQNLGSWQKDHVFIKLVLIENEIIKCTIESMLIWRSSSSTPGTSPVISTSLKSSPSSSRVSIWGLGPLLLVSPWSITHLMLAVALLILWTVLLCSFRCLLWTHLKHTNNVSTYFMNVTGLIMIKMRS